MSMINEKLEKIFLHFFFYEVKFSMEYNNALSTSHKDILRVLDLATERIEQEIEKISK